MIRNDRLDALVAGLPDHEAELVSTASSLAATLNAEHADTLRRLPEETVAGLRKAGLFRLATPRTLEGTQAGSRAVTAIAAEVARGCSSAAWVLTVYYSGGLALGLFPEAVQRRVWEADPDATVCGSSGTGAPARPVDGGYLISGRWGWASGAHHADWIVLDIVRAAPSDAIGSPASPTARVAPAAGSPADRGLALVPMRDLPIEDTWHMAGMRGTGSDTVIADDVFVPHDQVLFLSTPGLPRPQGLDSTLAGPLLGMGMAVYDHVLPLLRERAATVPALRYAIADAALLIDNAVLQASRSARLVDSGTRLTPLQEVRVRMDGALAARQIRRSAESLLDVAGAARFADASPAQRIWRDLNTAMRHPVFVLELIRDRYAHLLLAD
ncbi:acyl-CoA dehydrogenase family protein [Actinoplanes sp. NPDC051851]|uniref:acyl-CoA dehydrogenase family protein n=1 Tax=Actinoplanes sp. NPDC051851 TaxID=3154753 RepID=UPI003418164B